jgi:CheY-like chemotaxis protein
MEHLTPTLLSKTISILLIEDDRDDRYFFEELLSELPILSNISFIDGKNITDFFTNNLAPDLVFIDLNMPCKNGFVCLKEIKDNPDFQSIPVVIYSTSNNKNTNDELYRMGAHYYHQKTDLVALKKTLLIILTLLNEEELVRPPRNKFVINELN